MKTMRIQTRVASFVIAMLLLLQISPASWLADHLKLRPIIFVAASKLPS